MKRLEKGRNDNCLISPHRIFKGGLASMSSVREGWPPTCIKLKEELYPWMGISSLHAHQWSLFFGACFFLFPILLGPM